MFTSRTSRRHSSPQISTASLPDIVFILLFFFMVITNIRTAELMVDADVPRTQALTELKQSPLISNIYVGKPLIRDSIDAEYVIQIGDKIGTLSDIGPYITDFRNKLPADKRDLAITALKVDHGVPMYIIDDIKLELRKAGQLRINYFAAEEE
jgi:biopolymer transport protein ExbD